jgi:hypothetical protein
MDENRRRETGLFRYALIRDAADPGLSKAQRGRLLRALADREQLSSKSGRDVVCVTPPYRADSAVRVGDLTA